MNRFERCPGEEELIDAILRRTPSELARPIDEHVEGCFSCRRRRSEWERLLLGMEASRTADETGVIPRECVRRRLRRELDRIRWRRRWKEFWKEGLKGRRIGTRGALAAVGGVLLLGCLYGLWSQMHSRPVRTAAPAYGRDEAVMTEMQLALKAGTSQYEAQTADPAHIRGVAWVNRDSKEVLLLAEGLAYDRNHDYQVWSVTGNARRTIGLMSWAGGKAHIHVQGAGWDGAGSLTVSWEPKGGSFKPTGPELLTVRLEK